MNSIANLPCSSTMEIRKGTRKKEEKPAGASPLILAMKGHPSAGKSTIAQALDSSDVHCLTKTTSAAQQVSME
ncbi:hypothetical protein Nepgr_011026 [Nepenthes gracilis]|uniref:Uncharacterized protein n=1 Tax=Nepenthes gracilis TaxID=150966 RepID=A0AAD3SEB5_NEPGR|nr:hypothetical protein Nepgr_011026 [Nepenthes gracilis]